MEQVIDLGAELKFKIAFVDGKAQLSFIHEGKLGGAELKGFVNAEVLLDAIAAAIPGQVDDAVIAIIKGALK